MLYLLPVVGIIGGLLLFALNMYSNSNGKVLNKLYIKLYIFLLLVIAIFCYITSYASRSLSLSDDPLIVIHHHRINYFKYKNYDKYLYPKGMQYRYLNDIYANPSSGREANWHQHVRNAFKKLS